ncbi:MAG: phage baseplate protein, partial [Cetobacterium sp.]
MSYLKGYIGEIHSVDEVNYTARAKIFELDNSITEDLQITTSMASKKTICQLPKIGSPCLIIRFDDDTERGF